MSQPSTKGRQERRGSRTVSALPGRSAAARARSLQRTRAAATELAAHRRRLLATSIEGGEEGQDLLSADAMLLRVDPAAHHAGLARIAEAALVFDRNGHRAFKAPASDSRPPEFGLSHNGIPATDGSPAPASRPRTDLRPTDVNSPGRGYAGQQGLAASASGPAALLPVGGEGKTHTQEENH